MSISILTSLKRALSSPVRAPFCRFFSVVCLWWFVGIFAFLVVVFCGNGVEFCVVNVGRRMAVFSS